eukprot:TRINITY_DN7974_c0_g1_i3.p1 TRINITY_DN7974_c0_g1~~TRINITY_DN7974_c0_g1_i3.p1  ORF type:complete len:331 (-),score=104.25 TRINITY_DN7974_c0_g1_i3:22-1014(-)
MATKIMKQYSKIVGANWLRQTLRPVLQEVCAEEGQFEIDPKKLVEGDEEVEVDTSDQLARLLKYADKVFTAIVDSVDNCPIQFRTVCNHLQKEEFARFGEQDGPAKSVGGFIFLRYFCPAVTAPFGFGVLDRSEADRNAMRGFILIAKILQNLANNVEFGQKEPYMTPCNPFVLGNKDRYRTFLEQLTTIPAEAGMGATQQAVISEQEKEDQMQILARQITLTKDKMADLEYMKTKVTNDDETNLWSKVRVLCDFQAEAENELDLVKGDIAVVVEGSPGDEWICGECGGKIGWFPGEFVEKIEANVASSNAPPIERLEEILNSLELVTNE